MVFQMDAHHRPGLVHMVHTVASFALLGGVTAGALLSWIPDRPPGVHLAGVVVGVIAGGLIVWRRR